MKLALTATAVLSAAALALTGCSAPAESAPEPEAPAEMVAEETPTPDPEEEQALAAEQSIPGFGDTATVENADVTVKYLGRSTATEWSTAGAAEVIEFSVAITNNGDSPIEGYDVMFGGVYAGDSGEPFEEVYDMDNGWEGPDYSTITPGRTQTVKTAFEAPEPGLVQFMLSIGLSETIVFEGELTE